MVEGHLKVLVRFPPTHISHVWAIAAGIIGVAGPVTVGAVLVLIYQLSLQRQVIRLVIVFGRYLFI